MLYNVPRKEANMNTIVKHLSQVEEGMTLLNQDEVLQMVRAIRLVKNQAGTLYLFGNGGSHATASHFANDLNKIVSVRAVCVGDMTPVITAYGNDNGWENMYASHLAAVCKGKDGLVGISCSGNSANVIRGLEVGKAMFAIGMTGMSNDSAINHLELDALVHARVPDIRVQEDLHMIVCHAVVRCLQEDD